MAWNRRQFVAGLGVATLASACKRASSTDGSDETGVAPARPAKEPLTPGAREQLDPGFSPRFRAPLAFDREDLLEIRDGLLIRRDASLAEVARLRVPDVRSFAVLPDRSLIVVAEIEKVKRQVHHVVAGKVVATHASHADSVFPTDKANSYWAVAGGVWMERITIPTGTIELNLSLPNNTHSHTAEVAGDGSVVIASNDGVVHVDREVRTYAFEHTPQILAAGAEPMTVWAQLDTSKLVLLKLQERRATATATHVMAPGENLTHLAGNGAIATTIVARTIKPFRAAFTLVVFDAKGERWRVPLGEVDHGGFVSVASQTRVVTLDVRSNELRAWDLATGKPA